jgi:glycosyltransferase involved in cell wall biosynthesis
VVIPLGRRGDVVDILRAIDLHVLPSRSESFPNTVAEAMLSGVPCVVTHAGDAPLMVGDTGWVAPPKDPLSLAACIEEAYREFRDDKSEWQTRRSAARARIAKNYTSRRMASEYEAVWRSVAQKRNRS